MKISYLVCTHNETETLSRLLEKLISISFNEDEIFILDDFSTNKETQKIIDGAIKISKQIKICQHNLENDYSNHKNFGVEKCTGDWILQLDGDELPSEALILNIREIISTNDSVELFYIPRINDYKGVLPEHAQKWGWKLNEMEFFRPSENKILKAPLVQFPDFQGRLFINNYPRIHWERRLHEKIEGHNKYAFLPPDETLSLYHDKTIEKQEETNIKYNKLFSKEDNMGHKVI